MDLEATKQTMINSSFHPGLLGNVFGNKSFLLTLTLLFNHKDILQDLSYWMMGKYLNRDI